MYNSNKWLKWSVLVVSLWAASASGAPVSQAGARLDALLDSMDVEHHWPAGVHVNWRTGDPDGRPESATGKHTHCSAFVASAAEHLQIYILRPPEHAQILLANAQYDWLASEGPSHGWHEINGPEAAQRAANQGEFVVATYKNPHDNKPGHIAIVRPSDKSEREVRAEGPQITQAGATNYTSTSLREGFAGHPAALRENAVRYYGHAVGTSETAVQYPKR
jgi:hypothetical protein